VTRVWFCANCGYEVRARGRCHACKAKLVPSALPELETGPEDEEVAYRIDGWMEADRGRLIQRLNDLGIQHRFEEEELIVEASDEARVDDLVALLGESIAPSDSDEQADDSAGSGSGSWTQAFDMEDDDHDSSSESGDEGYDEDSDLAASVRLLADAATRLRMDPTDMQADADVAEASTAVFFSDRFGPFDEDAWSAVGRVTRKLLAALGADEALEGEIRQEAGVLEKLLRPVNANPGDPVADSADGAVAPGERTVYELADWLPDQRAELGVMLEEAGIAYDWEGDELLVPSAREAETEALFDQVTGGGEDEDGDDDEQRYHTVAELFAACGRLAGDPTDDSRRDLVLRWIDESEGPPLFGMDEIEWFRIRNKARALAGAIEGEHDPNEIYEQANELHEMLRKLV
jgi:hypothetical protein